MARIHLCSIVNCAARLVDVTEMSGAKDAGEPLSGDCDSGERPEAIQGALRSDGEAAEVLLVAPLMHQGEVSLTLLCGFVNLRDASPPFHSSVAQWQSIRLLTEGL
jgi:hypothetical protein